MAKRVRIADIMRVTGLSRSTVDRALNGRDRVHPRTQKVVLKTVAELQGSEARTLSDPIELAPAFTVDAVFRASQGFMRQFHEANDRMGSPVVFHDMHLKSARDVEMQIARLCEDIGRPLLVNVENDPRVHAELAEARKRGKRVIAIVSDLAPEARDAFVGIDNRRAGQTAAFLLGNALRTGPSVVGLVAGDYAFGCHEAREMGFRSLLRSEFPQVSVIETVVRQRVSSANTAHAVQTLLISQSGIRAIYNTAGGNAGLERALIECGKLGEVLVVTHETSESGAELLKNRTTHYTIAQDVEKMLRTAVELACEDKQPVKDMYYLDFSILTPFNLPLSVR